MGTSGKTYKTYKLFAKAPYEGHDWQSGKSGVEGWDFVWLTQPFPSWFSPAAFSPSVKLIASRNPSYPLTMPGEVPHCDRPLKTSTARWCPFNSRRKGNQGYFSCTLICQKRAREHRIQGAELAAGTQQHKSPGNSFLIYQLLQENNTEHYYGVWL